MEAVRSFEKLQISTNVRVDIQEDVTILNVSYVIT